jgi:ribosomal protein S18 acetylase RimI-like enzyme
MAVTIRPARADDARDIARLARQFAAYLRKLGDPTEFRLTAKTYFRDGFGDQPAFSGIVAEVEDKVVGYLLYHFGYDSDAAARNLHVVDLYVEPKARKRGAGTALMRAAAWVAAGAGAQELIWSVFKSNGLAASFYKKLGAQHITDLYFMKLPADAL